MGQAGGSGPGLEWRAEPSRSGEPTLCIADRWVHSRYAPRREAADLARKNDGADVVVLLGVGLGYLPAALAESDARVLAFDPFPEITAALPTPEDGWRQRVTVTTALPELEGWLGEHLAADRPARLVVHPGYGELCRFEARAIAERMRERSGGEATRGVGDAVVSARALDALERMPYRRNWAELAGSLAGRTALCVSPGPSLDAGALAALRERTGGVVFAALQALRPLQRAGVAVDFVVAPDPHDFEPHLAGLEPTFGALLADTSVRPALLDRWPDRTVLFHLPTPHLQQLAWQRAGLPVLDGAMTTVSETMLALADRLGAARFVLVGMDFCGAADRYRQLSFAARDASGRRVVTNGHYLAAARYLAHRCPALAAAGRPVLRVGSGLPVAGAEPAGPEALAPDEPAFAPPPAGPDRHPALWQAALQVAKRAGARGARGAAPPRGERPAARRMEDFHPLGRDAQRAGLVALRAHLEADPIRPAR